MRNSIWYRFSSEKDAYDIRFDTINISIKDIKKEIINRRNMLNYPEKFLLKFYDEDNPSIQLKDEDLIEPMRKLRVKRIPKYIEDSGFQYIVKDPRDIPLNKINENNLKRGEMLQIVRYNEPLEKISKYLNKEMLNKQFRCRLCNNLDENTYNNFIITLCCKENFCMNCYNKNNICPCCKNEKKGCQKNEAEIKLINKLLEILNKKEEQEKEQRAAALQQTNNKNNNTNNVSDINKNNMENNFQNNNNLLSNTPIKSIVGINPLNETLSPYQLQKQLMENCAFYIIKSSNLENIKKSKANSVWATTATSSKRLNEAFSRSKVILIFSAKDGIYKGYAIMTSYSAESPSNIWYLESTSIKLGGDFSVKWLCYCELPTSKTKQLALNKTRDCTELESSIGNKLCDLCYEQEKDDLEKNPQRITIEINEQVIQKINEEITNNKNKQLNKKKNINNNSLINNEQNKSNTNDTNETVVNNNPPIPQYPPQYPHQILYYPNPFMYTYHLAQMQQKVAGAATPGLMIPGMINPAQMQQQIVQQTQQAQQIQTKKEDEKKADDKDKKDSKDDKEKREHKKDKEKHRKNKRRSRSRDRSRSRSRHKNKSRSSRSKRSNSNSSRSEGKSKYSKSYK